MVLADGLETTEINFKYLHHRTEIMSLPKNQVALLFFLILSPLLHSDLFANAASTSSPVTHPRINVLTVEDDIDDDDEDHSLPPKVLVHARTPFLKSIPRKPCDYNPCSENQEPCAKLSKETQCLCPGISGADIPPLAPRIQNLVPIREGKNKGEVEVQWCSPSSVVSHYRVVIEGSKDNALEFQGDKRRASVGSLEVGTKVCVEALNDAGHNTPSKFSCMRYTAPESSDHDLMAWFIGGGVGVLLLVIIIAVILWKFKICQKRKRDSTDGLGNPSYSTERTL